MTSKALYHRLAGIALLMLILTYSSVADAQSFATRSNCSVSNASHPQASVVLRLHHGITHYQLKCNLSHPMVFSLNTLAVSELVVYSPRGQRLPTMRASAHAVTLEAGLQTYQLHIHASVPKSLEFSLSTPNEFQHQQIEHAIIMFSFLGFCGALVLYVGTIGHSIRSQSFYAYSAYILSAALFFAAQEHILKLIFHDISLLHNYYFATLMAGITVYTGQCFVAKLLDFSHTQPRWLANTISGLAISVIVMALFPMLVQASWAIYAHAIMGYLTLTTMGLLLGAIVIAMRKQVQCASLVLASCLIMLGAMLIRVVTPNLNEFLAHYALIIGITIEAFLLSLAASAKVRRLYVEKILAIENANKDSLCACYNKRGWYTAADKLVELHREQGGALALMYIDLDKFKDINDSFGHQVGDTVLMTIASIIKRQIRATDIVGRLGGDEFAVMGYFPHELQAQKLIDRITFRLQDLVLNIDDKQIALSASVGGKLLTQPVDNIHNVLHESDLAMYQTKMQKT